MSSGTIVIVHLRGSKAVARVRKMLGGTDPSTAEPGSLRGTYGIDKTNNFMVTPPLPPLPLLCVVCAQCAQVWALPAFPACLSESVLRR
jgi:nucleoside diphosphate kinase